MNTTRIDLFADAGPGVGTGHIFRLYPVFSCLRKLGVDAEMSVPLSAEELQALGVEGVQPVSGDCRKTIEAFCRSDSGVVVLDTYRHLQDWFQAICGGGRQLAIFDDHFRVDRKVDLIVNSSPAVTEEDYPAGLANRFLLGTSYASLFAGFTEARERYMVAPRVSNILVALGGSDTRGNLPELLRVLNSLLLQPVELRVLGEHIIDIKVHDYVKLSVGWLDQKSLARRMPDFDLAILAGGSMLWQTCCVGVPTISWPQAPGQQRHAGALERKGAVKVIHDLDELPEAFVRLQAQDQRVKLSNAGRGLFDGQGATRIASCLLEMLGADNAH